MRKLMLTVAAVLAVPGLAAAQELSGTLKKIKETGSISLGHRDSSVPFSYIDDNGKVIGYSLDICAKIVEAVKTELKLDKLDVRLVPVTSSTRIPLIANGTIDLECGSTTNNEERQKQVGYTNTHFLTASAFVSKKVKNLKKIDDLKGKTVVSTAGTTNMKQLVEANAARNLGINVMSAKDHAASFLLVELDRADAFVMDDILLASLIASSKDPGAYQTSDDAFSLPEPYAIMLRKDDAPFKALADKATSALFRSAEGAALYAKWFTSAIPPKGLNLNVPVGEKLKKAYAAPTDNPDPKAY
ncbi:amino acid ABC transporter substrate-binding protein [Candidatus Raskinella chloraquaticus]|uniref:ABC transporter n=1 Tax=Candidatus Raskinella chloraquaticus TaxID=1951219 RepID=A0A1W9I0J5_9HYPH|nr:MAG: ABC transporter [Proteobacteria bacterium SG_bin8]